MTRILNVVPTTTEQSLIVSSGNPSNNDKRLISRYYYIVEANYWRTAAELLVHIYKARQKSSPP